MGLIKAWKEAKAVLATGPPTGQRQPHQPGGMMAGFANVMIKMAAPMLAAQAPERGAPFPGTEAGVGAAQDAAALAAAVAGLRARDSAFDGGVLATFAGQVFATVASAWGTGDSVSIRPLLADHLFEPISAALATAQTGAGQIFAHESARPTLAGVWAGAVYDSALISFAVSVDLPPDPSGQIPPEMMHWNEEWLFQRSVTAGGDTTQAAPTCPACGAPVANQVPSAGSGSFDLPQRISAGAARGRGALGGDRGDVLRRQEADNLVGHGLQQAGVGA